MYTIYLLIYLNDILFLMYNLINILIFIKYFNSKKKLIFIYYSSFNVIFKYTKSKNMIVIIKIYLNLLYLFDKLIYF